MDNYGRSVLFVPGIDKYLKRYNSLVADTIVIDLEDSIRETDKSNALKRVCEFLSSNTFSRDVFIRINSFRMNAEITKLSSFNNIAGFMVPKVETNDCINEAYMLGQKKIFALVETPRGILNLEDIAANSKVCAIGFGAEDYTMCCEIQNDDNCLSYAKGRIVTCAKAFNKPVYDTVSTNIKDSGLYRVEAQMSKNYGFTGKMAIHPMQVEIIKNVYRDNNIEKYKTIIKKYEKSGEGVIVFEDKVYDKPHIELISRKIKEKNEDRNW